MAWNDLLQMFALVGFFVVLSWVDSWMSRRPRSDRHYVGEE